jgi:hypothetical protein
MLPLPTLLLAAATSAFAGDDLSGAEISYEGGYSATAANYVKGKPVSVSHTGGNVSVRCLETDKLSARLQYVVYGSQEGPMESMGKGIAMSVTGDSTAGRVSVRVPSKPSGVAKAEVTLTVNVPRPTTAVTVSQTGGGWVQVIDCDGNVKVTAGGGGAFASGHLTGATVTAAGGDVKVVQNDDAVFKLPATVTAPGGNATLLIASAQGGKLLVKGTEVAVAQTVMGTNASDIVQGDLGLAGPQITVTAKAKAQVSPNK